MDSSQRKRTFASLQRIPRRARKANGFLAKKKDFCKFAKDSPQSSQSKWIPRKEKGLLQVCKGFPAELAKQMDSSQRKRTFASLQRIPRRARKANGFLAKKKDFCKF